MVGLIVLAVAFILVMVLSTGVMVSVVEEWASKLKNKKIFLATVILALVGAAPEMAIAISSAVSGIPLVGLGNAIGANLANLGLVVAGLVVFVGVIPVVGEYANKILWLTVFLAVLPFILFMDGDLTRFDGVALLFGYLVYLYFVIKTNKIELKQAKLHKHKTIEKDIVPMRIASVIMFVLGGATLLVCSTFLIRLVSNVAVNLGVSSFWIGLVFISLATTLPELLIGVWNHKKISSLITVEKLLGSIITNSTLVIGTLALISPMTLGNTLSKEISGIFLIFIFGLFWLFTKSKRKLERWEGVVMLGVYLMFLGLQMLFTR